MNANRHAITDGASSLPERLPPQNLEAERAMLGCCLLDPRKLDEAVEVVQAADLYLDQHRTVWDAMVAIRERGGRLDAITLADELIRLGQFDQIGGDETLTELVDSVRHAANAAYYAGIVREKSVARQVLEAGEEMLRDVYSYQHTASELVCRAEERIFAVGEADAGQAWPMDVLTDETMARLELRREGGSPGLASGFGDLDGMTGGFQAGTVTVLAARPSQGKTALALAIARHVGSSEPVLFVSLEMSRHEIGDRLLSMVSGVPGAMVREARMLSDRSLGRLHDAAAELTRLQVKLDDSPNRTVSQIAALARRTKRRSGLGLVVVDYLGLIDGVRRKGESRQEEVARISRGLKVAAKLTGVPWLVLAQLNRQSEHRERRRPELSDLRESGQIEADADLVLMLHRPEFYDANDQPGIAELLVRKNRNGATGVVRLVFRKECTSFDGTAAYVEPADSPAF